MDNTIGQVDPAEIAASIHRAKDEEAEALIKEYNDIQAKTSKLPRAHRDRIVAYWNYHEQKVKDTEKQDGTK